MENLMLIENGLIKVYKTDKGEYVVDGRDLWQGLESRQKFTDWVTARLVECDAVENEEFFINLGKTSEQGGRPTKEYIIKLDTAKEMAMLERNEMGKQYRRYMIDIEKKYQKGETAKKVESDAAKEELAKAKLKNANARIANICLKIAEQVSIPEYKQIMYSKATEVLFDEKVLPLPDCERKTYSAKEIGERLGISANKVGKLANENKLKTAEYGKLVWDKSQYSNKQVETWRYYDSVIPKLQELLILAEC